MSTYLNFLPYKLIYLEIMNNSHIFSCHFIFMYFCTAKQTSYKDIEHHLCCACHLCTDKFHRMVTEKRENNDYNNLNSRNAHDNGFPSYVIDQKTQIMY